MDAIIPLLVPDMLTGETRLKEPEVVAYLQTVMQGASDDAIGGAVALAERPDSRDTLDRIEVPTLVLLGLAGAVYPVAVSRRMHEQIPNATLAIVPGASHAAVFEAPERSAAAIADWAQRLR